MPESKESLLPDLVGETSYGTKRSLAQIQADITDKQLELAEFRRHVAGDDGDREAFVERKRAIYVKQIEQLQSQLARLDDDVANAPTQIARLEKELAKLQVEFKLVKNAQKLAQLKLLMREADELKGQTKQG